MLSLPDFSKKQIVFVLFNEGEKMALSNSNLVIKKADETIKLQISCYRLFLVFAIGNCSITSPIIKEANKYGFFIALMTPQFRIYSLIGSKKDGNTLLHKKQYSYHGQDIAKHIVSNKIKNQINELKLVRNKSEAVKEAISTIDTYYSKIPACSDINEIMAYEGLSSKIYFKNHFNNILWQGRQPRIKRDYVNSTLDIGYTLLFAYIDALLQSYGFDTYIGVLHTQFYMRKSLTCDIVEPFRILIDHELKKSINLGIIKEKDFIIQNNQYKLKWEETSKYIKVFMMPMIENKEKIFSYIQLYYRSFMKGKNVDDFPVFSYGE